MSFMASTRATTLCCLMSMCWMGRSRSSFFVGIAYIGYQRFALCWSGVYVNFDVMAETVFQLFGTTGEPQRHLVEINPLRMSIGHNSEGLKAQPLEKSGAMLARVQHNLCEVGVGSHPRPPRL